MPAEDHILSRAAGSKAARRFLSMTVTEILSYAPAQALLLAIDRELHLLARVPELIRTSVARHSPNDEATTLASTRTIRANTRFGTDLLYSKIIH